MTQVLTVTKSRLKKRGMSLIKNLYILSVSYTHFKIFLSIFLNKRPAFHTYVKSFPSVVLSDIDVVLTQHRCE